MRPASATREVVSPRSWAVERSRSNSAWSATERTIVGSPPASQAASSSGDRIPLRYAASTPCATCAAIFPVPIPKSRLTRQTSFVGRCVSCASVADAQCALMVDSTKFTASSTPPSPAASTARIAASRLQPQTSITCAMLDSSMWLCTQRASVGVESVRDEQHAHAREDHRQCLAPRTASQCASGHDKNYIGFGI